MKTTILRIFASSQLILCSGCANLVSEPQRGGHETDSAELLVHLLGATVVVAPVAVPQGGPAVEMNLRTVFQPSDIRERTLRIEPDFDTLSVGYSASIHDTSGNLLFRLTERAGLWPDGASFYFLEERTPSEYLVLRAWDSDSISREDYVINGQARQWRYSRGTATEAAAADGYAAFYDSAVSGRSSGLVVNDDATILLELVSRQEFAAWMQRAPRGKFDQGQFQGTPACSKKCINRICAVSAACMRLKCRLGGPSNVLCVSCSGVATACLIRSIGCMVFDCD